MNPAPLISPMKLPAPIINPPKLDFEPIDESIGRDCIVPEVGNASIIANSGPGGA